MIIDGRTLAHRVLERAKARAEKLPHPPRVQAFVVSETRATLSYLKIKEMRAIDAGCVLEVSRLSPTISSEELSTIVSSTVADAVIVQLPLPNGIDAKEVCDAIPVSKDADVLSAAGRTKLERADADALLPPVVGALREILSYGHFSVKGKKAVVIGEGWLVGSPCATWLKQQGALVTVVTLESGDVRSAVSEADIIVSGAGSPGLIQPNYIKPGTVLIDAGTSESNGVIVGDADPLCAEKCAIFTPVPGGVGPLAVAMLFENAVTLAERAINN